MVKIVRKIERAPIAGRAGGPRTSLVNPLVGPPKVTLGDALGSIGKGFADLAQAAHEDDVKRDNIKAVQVEGAFQREVEAGLAKLDPLAPDYTDGVQQLVGSATESAKSTADFQTGDVADLTDARLTAMGERYQTLAQGDRRTAIEKAAVAERKEGVDAVLANIRRDPDAIATYIQKFTQDLQRLNTGIAPANQREFAAQFSDATLIAQVEGLALASRFKEARALADLQEEDLSPTQFRTLKKRIRGIEQKDRQDRETENEAELADLEIFVLNEKDPEVARAAVQDALDRGVFAGKDSARPKYERIILAKEKELRKLADERELIQRKLPTGLDTQKEADIHWRMRVENEAPRLAKLSPEAREAALLQMAVDLAPRTGFLPTDFKRLVENAEHLEDPAVLARAAQISDAIHAVAPAVDTGIGDRGKAVAAAHKTLGFKYADAANYILQRFPDDKVLKQRIKDFPDFVGADYLAAQALADVFDVDKTQVPTLAAIQYDETLRLMFNQSGDIALAQEVTARKMEERFGVTHVGSADLGVVMLYPPEMFTPGRAKVTLSATQQAMIYTADAQRSLDDLGIKPVIPDAGGEPDRQIKFVVTNRTLRQIAAGERPEYDVHMLNSFGIYERTPISYVMPTVELLNAIPEYAAIADAAQAKADDQRARNKANEQSAIGAGEGVDPSTGQVTPGIPQATGPTPFELPTQGLPPDAAGVLTGTGGG